MITDAAENSGNLTYRNDCCEGIFKGGTKILGGGQQFARRSPGRHARQTALDGRAQHHAERHNAS